MHTLHAVNHVFDLTKPNNGEMNLATVPVVLQKEFYWYGGMFCLNMKICNSSTLFHQQ